MTASTHLPEDGLAVDGVTVRFGGALALDGVSVVAPLGRVTGLIGPNGAGKTTLFNAANGLLRPTHGSVRLFGEDVTGMGPAARAQRGLGRTFQRLELCDSMTVAQNVALGREARFAGRRPWRQLVGTGAQNRAVASAVEDALVFCDLVDVAERPVASLSTGRQRLVELARACAAGFRVLLLDEPSAGLDDRETGRVGEIILELAGARGIGVLLVEHDMNLVMSACEHIFVLDFGRLVFGGTPEEARSSETVKAAYLGVAEGSVDAAMVTT